MIETHEHRGNLTANDLFERRQALQIFANFATAKPNRTWGALFLVGVAPAGRSDQMRALDAYYTKTDRSIDCLLAWFDELYRRAKAELALADLSRPIAFRPPVWERIEKCEEKLRIEFDIFAANYGIDPIYLDPIFARVFGSIRLGSLGQAQDFWKVRGWCEDELYALMGEK